MSRHRLVRTVALAAIATLTALLTGTTAASAAVDRTPPSAPSFGYAQGFYCLTLIIGVNKSTDDVTPQSQLRYDIYDSGVRIGALEDRGSGPWAVLQMPGAGPGTHMITVRAIDAAGNRSAPTRTVPVTGYFTPGCVPYHF